MQIPRILWDQIAGTKSPRSKSIRESQSLHHRLSPYVAGQTPHEADPEAHFTEVRDGVVKHSPERA
ncbi:hypothetical protein SCOCK_160139 [Actinacidiphila cocklensis]|uniref:Uncharacterized protein n=1 Tax=Actinacidiphila cocklensis TaxID=887465 RepID=A0A9W4E3Z4_9ACTN|nr:hypothetical protein SCOCK_160139 [Actinacidiphila cocklensis]